MKPTNGVTMISGPGVALSGERVIYLVPPLPKPDEIPPPPVADGTANHALRYCNTRF
jgi:hypothetical protein